MTGLRAGPNTGVSEETLGLLAHRAGIQSEWWTIDGVHHSVSPDTLSHLLRAMRLPADSEAEARESLERLELQYEIPPVIVRREGDDIDSSDWPSGWLHIELDSGQALQVRQGQKLSNLPIGRHRIWSEESPNKPIRLTVAPKRAWLPEEVRNGAKIFGISAQLYSLRRTGDQGIGDFTTLAQFAREATATGAALIGINPLHALFSERRDRASPYWPSDRRFIDPIYLDVDPLDGVPQGRFIDYDEVWPAKETALRHRFETASFSMPECPALRQFATFNALSRHFEGEPWSAWPFEYQDPESPSVRDFADQYADEVRFQAFLQHLCDVQLAEAMNEAASMPVGLYRDLAVGAAADGAEAWCLQSLLASIVSIGAPPDPLAPKGQVWNLPPPNPHAMAASGYEHFSNLLGANMRHAGALRIDHAMAFSRLFWVPEGADGREGTYVSYPMADLVGEAALASVKSRCMIVAEALGTVPEGFEQALSEADMFSYRVAFLERDGTSFRRLAEFPHKSLACITSHDLPTFAGWWTGADIAERQTLGLREDFAAAAAFREQEKEALLELAAAPPNTGQSESTVATAVHSVLGRAGSAIVVVQAEELLLEDLAINVPGTDRERPNWRRRLRSTVHEMFEAGANIIEAVQNGREAPEKDRQTS